MVTVFPPGSLHSVLAGGLGRLLLSCCAEHAAHNARDKKRPVQNELTFRMMIYLPQSLLLGTACVTPVILPCLGATSKRCVGPGNTRVAAVLLRATACRCSG